MIRAFVDSGVLIAAVRAQPELAGGALLPLIAAAWYGAVDAPTTVAVTDAVLALVGLAVSEWAWVEAGQVVPLG
jgi:hypothetical protein